MYGLYMVQAPVWCNGEQAAIRYGLYMVQARIRSYDYNKYVDIKRSAHTTCLE